MAQSMRDWRFSVPSRTIQGQYFCKVPNVLRSSALKDGRCLRHPWMSSEDASSQAGVSVGGEHCVHRVYGTRYRAKRFLMTSKKQETAAMCYATQHLRCSWERVLEPPPPPPPPPAPPPPLEKGQKPKSGPRKRVRGEPNIQTSTHPLPRAHFEVKFQQPSNILQLPSGNR